MKDVCSRLERVLATRCNSIVCKLLLAHFNTVTYIPKDCPQKKSLYEYLQEASKCGNGKYNNALKRKKNKEKKEREAGTWVELPPKVEIDCSAFSCLDELTCSKSECIDNLAPSRDILEKVFLIKNNDATKYMFENPTEAFKHMTGTLFCILE